MYVLHNISRIFLVALVFTFVLKKSDLSYKIYIFYFVFNSSLHAKDKASYGSTFMVKGVWGSLLPEITVRVSLLVPTLVSTLKLITFLHLVRFVMALCCIGGM